MSRGSVVVSGTAVEVFISSRRRRMSKLEMAWLEASSAPSMCWGGVLEASSSPSMSLQVCWGGVLEASSAPSMTVWQCGSVVVWQCGSVTVGLCGCVLEASSAPSMTLRVCCFALTASLAGLRRHIRRVGLRSVKCRASIGIQAG